MKDKVTGNESPFTLKNYQAAKEFFLKNGMSQEKINGYSGYELILMWINFNVEV